MSYPQMIEDVDQIEGPKISHNGDLQKVSDETSFTIGDYVLVRFTVVRYTAETFIMSDQYAKLWMLDVI